MQVTFFRKVGFFLVTYIRKRGARSTLKTASLPYICNWICIVLQAQLAVLLTRRNMLSPTGIRRSFHIVAGVIPSVCLGLITPAGCDTTLVLVYISIAVCFTGFAYSTAFNPNVLDLAPNYSDAVFRTIFIIAKFGLKK